MKKRGMKKRVLAALMTACMVVGSVPGVSLADVSGEPSGTLTPAAKKYNFDGTASTEADPDIELNKTAAYNGTFTENGQTEFTKVGTKLTLADIPASKGKSSSYSDQTWDKFPVGYIVGKDGTTFTITYKWRSSGSGSDYDYSTSTRGKATNAAGKSGRWILEGGEFTEDNGTTQEDTCTPAGMRSMESGTISTRFRQARFRWGQGNTWRNTCEHHNTGWISGRCKWSMDPVIPAGNLHGSPGAGSS